MIPKVHYAETGSGLVAYQVFGQGPSEVVYCEGIGFQLEIAWEHPTVARFLEGLGSFARVLIFDPRGVGLSDAIPNKEHPTWEDGVEDLKAVIAAAGMKRPALFMIRSAGRAGLIFAATNPDHVSALILGNASAYLHQGTDYLEGHSAEKVRILEQS